MKKDFLTAKNAEITKRGLSLFAFFVFFAVNSLSTTVNYQSWYFTGTTNNRPITITLLSQGVLYNGAAVFGIPQTFQPIGGLVSTNLVPANYTITVGGNGIPYPFSVPNTTNTYNIWDLVNAGLYVLTPTNAVLNGASNTVFNTATLNGGTINNAFLFSPYIGQDTNWITLWAPNSTQNLMSYGYHIQPGYVLLGVSNITVWVGQTVNNAPFIFVNDPGNLVLPHLQWGFGNTNDLINGYTNPPMAYQDQINSANGPNAYWHVGTNAGTYPGLWPGFLAAYGTNLPPLMMASNMNAQKIIANEIRAHGIIQSEQLALLSNAIAVSLSSSNIQGTNIIGGTYSGYVASGTAVTNPGVNSASITIAPDNAAAGVPVFVASEPGGGRGQLMALSVGAASGVQIDSLNNISANSFIGPQTPGQYNTNIVEFNGGSTNQQATNTTFWGTTIGAGTNLIEPTLTPDTNALNFANLVGITDVGTRNDLVNFMVYINQAGLGPSSPSNMTEAVLLNPRFNPGSNLTFFGRTIANTSQCYSAWGAYMPSNYSILVSGLPDLHKTNTIVAVWRAPSTNNNGGGTGLPGGWIAGLQSPSVAAAGQGIAFGEIGSLIQFTGDTGGHSADDIAPSLGGVTWNYLLALNEISARSVTTAIFSNATPVCYSYVNGSQCKYSGGNFSTTLSAGAVTDPLTQLTIGYSPAANAAYGFPYFNGEVAAVLVFNCCLNSNQAVLIQKALRCLETDTIERAFCGDSLWATYNSPNALNQPVGYPTNLSVPSWFMHSGGHSNENIWANFSVGGNALSFMAGGNAPAPSIVDNINRAFPFVPGKSLNRYFYLQGGVNDFYSGGASAAGTYLNLTNITMPLAAQGWAVTVEDVAHLWTNAYITYTYNATTESTISTYNNLLLNNQAPYFGNLFRRDLFYTQWLMNSNNGYSFDGLHPMSITNGWNARRMEAENLQGLPPEPGTTLINFAGGSIWTLNGGSNVFEVDGAAQFTNGLAVGFGGTSTTATPAAGNIIWSGVASGNGAGLTNIGTTSGFTYTSIAASSITNLAHASWYTVPANHLAQISVNYYLTNTGSILVSNATHPYAVWDTNVFGTTTTSSNSIKGGQITLMACPSDLITISNGGGGNTAFGPAGSVIIQGIELIQFP